MQALLDHNLNMKDPSLDADPLDLISRQFKECRERSDREAVAEPGDALAGSTLL